MIDFLKSIQRQLITDLEASYVELVRCSSPSEAKEMIEHVTELAKMGYTADELAKVARAAEHQEILAFEYGRIRRIGKSRPLQQINEEGW